MVGGRLDDLLDVRSDDVLGCPEISASVHPHVDFCLESASTYTLFRPTTSLRTSGLAVRVVKRGKRGGAGVEKYTPLCPIYRMTGRCDGHNISSSHSISRFRAFRDERRQHLGAGIPARAGPKAGPRVIASSGMLVAPLSSNASSAPLDLTANHKTERLWMRTLSSFVINVFPWHERRIARCARVGTQPDSGTTKKQTQLLGDRTIPWLTDTIFFLMSNPTGCPVKVISYRSAEPPRGSIRVSRWTS